MIGNGAGAKTIIVKWTIEDITLGITESNFIKPEKIDIFLLDGFLIKFLSSDP